MGSKVLRLSVLMATLAAPAWAQMTPIAKLDCTPSNFPGCGWGPAAANPFVSRTLRTGAGPQGQNAVEFANLPSSVHAQYYLGWFGPSLPTPSQGVTRYIRVRYKTLGPMIPMGVADYWTNKFIILSDGADSSSRVICDLNPAAANGDPQGDPLAIACHRNIDGEPNSTRRISLQNNRWHSIQLEVRSSRTSSSADGQLKMWINSGNYSAPTSASGLFQLNTSNWGNINLGFYANATLASGSRVTFQVADFEFDDQFDPNFVEAPSGGASALPPAPPTNLRLLSSVGLLPLGAFGLSLFRLRSRKPLSRA